MRETGSTTGGKSLLQWIHVKVSSPCNPFRPPSLPPSSPHPSPTLISLSHFSGSFFRISAIRSVITTPGQREKDATPSFFSSTAMSLERRSRPVDRQGEREEGKEGGRQGGKEGGVDGSQGAR